MPKDTWFFENNPLAVKKKVKCPWCGSDDVKVIGNGLCWECQKCGKKYYPTDEDKEKLSLK